jgi:hypothetical protein
VEQQQQEQLESGAGHQSTSDAGKKVIDWEPIARELNRSRNYCQQKWSRIKPGILAKSSELKKGSYSLEEDAIIRKRVAQWDKKGKKRGLWSGLGRELGRTLSSVFERGKILPPVGEANPLGVGGSDSDPDSDSDSDCDSDPGESRPIAVGGASASGAFKGSFTEKMVSDIQIFIQIWILYIFTNIYLLTTSLSLHLLYLSSAGRSTAGGGHKIRTRLA